MQWIKVEVLLAIACVAAATSLEAITLLWVSPINAQTISRCGGALIAPTWVLTAGHCVDPGATKLAQGYPPGNFVAAGTLTPLITSTGHRSEVVRSIPHPDFDLDTLHNDVALIKLATSITGVRLAKIATADYPDLPAGAKVWGIGWGHVYESGVVPPSLMETKMPIVSHQECRRLNNWTDIYDSTLCTGFNEGGRDTCQGDSGGPLVHFGEDGSAVQVGITSFGLGEGCSVEMLANNKCDVECVTNDCGLDNYFCHGICAERCLTSMIHNGVCDPNCLIANCSYDGGDCSAYNDSCALNCARDAPHNGVCDPECNVKECNFDGGDCAKYAHCKAPYEILGDGRCNLKYNTTACLQDGGDCVFCAARCSLSMINNSVCDPACYTVGDNVCQEACFNSACQWDNFDCWRVDCNDDTCLKKWAGDGYCQRECLSASCGFEGGDCFDLSSPQCAPGCYPVIHEHNGVCDPACMNAACGFDAPDCHDAPAPRFDFESQVGDEALLCVVACLGPRDVCSARRVCRRWNRVSTSPLIWSSLEIRVASRSQYVRRLRLTREVGMAGTCALAGAAPAVRHLVLEKGLNFGHVENSVPAAQAIVSLWPALETLRGPSVRPEFSSIVSSVVSVSALRRLRVLSLANMCASDIVDLSKGRSPTSALLPAMPGWACGNEDRPCFERLRLRARGGLTDDAVAAKALHALRVAGLSVEVVSLPTAGLFALACAETLTSLDLWVLPVFHTELPGTSNLAFLAQLPRLRTLRVRSIGTPSVEGLEEPPAELRSLHLQVLDPSVDKQVAEVIRALCSPRLERLSVDADACTAAIGAITDSAQGVESLSLAGFSLDRGSSLSLMLASLPRLRSLDVLYCDFLNAVPQRIARFAGARLERLSLTTEFDHVHLFPLWRSGPGLAGLTQLNLLGHELSVPALRSMSAYFTRLHSLCVTVPKVKGRKLAVFADGSFAALRMLWLDMVHTRRAQGELDWLAAQRRELRVFVIGTESPDDCWVEWGDRCRPALLPLSSPADPDREEAEDSPSVNSRVPDIEEEEEDGDEDDQFSDEDGGGDDYDYESDEPADENLVGSAWSDDDGDDDDEEYHTPGSAFRSGEGVFFRVNRASGEEGPAQATEAAGVSRAAGSAASAGSTEEEPPELTDATSTSDSDSYHSITDDESLVARASGRPLRVVDLESANAGTQEESPAAEAERVTPRTRVLHDEAFLRDVAHSLVPPTDIDSAEMRRTLADLAHSKGGGKVRTAVAAVLPLWVLGDRNGDGHVDCGDACPDDALKHSAPGHCGCGAPETDTDGDGLPDCADLCPLDPRKLAPGKQGCGVPERPRGAASRRGGPGAVVEGLLALVGAQFVAIAAAGAVVDAVRWLLRDGRLARGVAASVGCAGALAARTASALWALGCWLVHQAQDAARGRNAAAPTTRRAQGQAAERAGTADPQSHHAVAPSAEHAAAPQALHEPHTLAVSSGSDSARRTQEVAAEESTARDARERKVLAEISSIRWPAGAEPVDMTWSLSLVLPDADGPCAAPADHRAREEGAPAEAATEDRRGAVSTAAAAAPQGASGDESYGNDFVVGNVSLKLNAKKNSSKPQQGQDMSFGMDLGSVGELAPEVMQKRLTAHELSTELSEDTATKVVRWLTKAGAGAQSQHKQMPHTARLSPQSLGGPSGVAEVHQYTDGAGVAAVEIKSGSKLTVSDLSAMASLRSSGSGSTRTAEPLVNDESYAADIVSVAALREPVSREIKTTTDERSIEVGLDTDDTSFSGSEEEVEEESKLTMSDLSATASLHSSASGVSKRIEPQAQGESYGADFAGGASPKLTTEKLRMPGTDESYGAEFVGDVQMKLTTAKMPNEPQRQDNSFGMDLEDIDNDDLTPKELQKRYRLPNDVSYGADFAGDTTLKLAPQRNQCNSSQVLDLSSFGVSKEGQLAVKQALHTSMVSLDVSSIVLELFPQAQVKGKDKEAVCKQTEAQAQELQVQRQEREVERSPFEMTTAEVEALGREGPLTQTASELFGKLIGWRVGPTVTEEYVRRVQDECPFGGKQTAEQIENDVFRTFKGSAEFNLAEHTRELHRGLNAVAATLLHVLPEHYALKGLLRIVGQVPAYYASGIPGVERATQLADRIIEHLNPGLHAWMVARSYHHQLLSQYVLSLESVGRSLVCVHKLWAAVGDKLHLMPLVVALHVLANADAIMRSGSNFGRLIRDLLMNEEMVDAILENLERKELPKDIWDEMLVHALL
eukprot:m51a1_g10800 putative notch domain-containing protein (2235) ;mRNA; r:15033-27460